MINLPYSKSIYKPRKKLDSLMAFRLALRADLVIWLRVSSPAVAASRLSAAASPVVAVLYSAGVMSVACSCTGIARGCEPASAAIFFSCFLRAFLFISVGKRTTVRFEPCFKTRYGMTIWHYTYSKHQLSLLQSLTSLQSYPATSTASLDIHGLLAQLDPACSSRSSTQLASYLREHC